MFQIGEHIIHPGQGVCTVMGYEEGPNPMIVLEAKSGHAKTRMLYPRSQEDRLHPCISAEEAESLIAGFGELECDPFTERNSSLEESYFRQQLKHGAPETVRIAKTMLCRIIDAEANDRKPSSYYSRILKEAHRRTVEELAAALDATEEDIETRLHHAAKSAGVALSTE